jgi:chromate transporter
MGANGNCKKGLAHKGRSGPECSRDEERRRDNPFMTTGQSSPPSPSLAPVSAPLARPASLMDLFVSFTWLALQGFGGVLAVVQRELVEKKRWLTLEQFVEEWAIAQIMPGPNVVNLALMLGHRYFGFKGAMVALAGMLTAPLVVALALATTYSHFGDNPQVQGALRGMSAVAAGLIVATGLKLIGALKNNPMGRVWSTCLAAATFVLVAWVRLPLVYVILVLGSAGCWVCYRNLPK